MKIEIGSRIGNGTVIEDLGIRKTGYVNHGKDQTARFWRLKCDCGKFYTCKTSNLTNKSVKSCSCLRRSQRNELGKKYGFLTVTEKLGVRQKNNNPNTKNQIWKLKCVCGKEIERPTSQLKVIYSCGCKNREIYKPTNQTRYFQELKRGAIRRDIDFNVTEAQVQKLLEHQNFKCALTGRRISHKEGTASLDRISSSGVYEIQNVQWIHREINIFKNSWSNQEFINICEEVSNFSRQKS